MKSIYIFLENRKIIKKEETKNYNIDDYKNPSEKNIQKDENNKPMYRRKTIIDKNGKKNIITVAIMKDKGPQGGSTQITSKWKEK